MFEDIFTSIQKKNSEIKCIGVWGKDGLELEHKDFSEFRQDIELIGAQLADILTRFETISQSSLSHNLRVNYVDSTLLVFSLTKDYFMVVLTDHTVIPGRLDFYVRLHRDKLISSL